MTRPITRILVPTDFSTATELALDYAVTVASRFGASLQLLHVVDDPLVTGAVGSEVYITSLPSLRQRLIDDAARRLGRLAFTCGRVAARREVRIGRPADAICEVAREEGCDLIVMGTHGRTGMAHVLLGSVAEQVVRKAPCPVLTVRDSARLAFERDLCTHHVAVNS